MQTTCLNIFIENLSGQEFLCYFINQKRLFPGAATRALVREYRRNWRVRRSRDASTCFWWIFGGFLGDRNPNMWCDHIDCRDSTKLMKLRHQWMNWKEVLAITVMVDSWSGALRARGCSGTAITITMCNRGTAVTRPLYTKFSLVSRPFTNSA